MSELSKRDVRRILREAIEPGVSPHGFRLSGDRFIRKMPGGSQGISVALYDYRPLFEFTASIGIRLDAVEDFVAPFTGVLPQHQSITLTSLTQLEHFGLQPVPGRGVLYRGDEVESISSAAGDLADVVAKYAVPFLDQYRDLASVEAGLNPPGAESLSSPIWPEDRSRFDGSIEPYRAMRGIATGYLAGNPRLPALIEAYRGQLSGMVDEIRLMYESLAVHIHSQI